MSNGRTTEDVRCELHQFERNGYFYGKLMTVRDFEIEQRYGLEHRYLHNQSLHGRGVRCGLALELKSGAGNETKLVVKPGIALDCCGREIVLARDQEVDLMEFQARIGTVEAIGKTVYLCIKYDECYREPVPALANVSTCEEVCQFNRIQEKAAFEVLTELPEVTPSGVCEIWLNLTTARAEITEGAQVIAEFERDAPRWVRQGDVFEVRRRIKPTVSNKTIQMVDVLPDDFTLQSGLLEMTVANTVEGKVVQNAYLVKVAGNADPAKEYEISGQVLSSPPASLSASEVEVISSAKRLEQQIQEQLFEQQFKNCPLCGAAGHCVILARITLQQQGSSFIVAPISGIDNVTFDAERGIYRQLVYPMSLMAEMLECLKRKCMERAPLTESVPDAPDIRVDPTSVDFGLMLIGTTTVPKTITVANGGIGTLIVSGIALAGNNAANFNLSGGPTDFPASFAPNESFELEVTFTPAILGAHSAAVTISSNDPDESQVTVTLSGSGDILT